MNSQQQQRVCICFCAFCLMFERRDLQIIHSIGTVVAPEDLIWITHSHNILFIYTYTYTHTRNAYADAEQYTSQSAYQGLKIAESRAHEALMFYATRKWTSADAALVRAADPERA
jgi:branched-subunit amino acid permease